MTNPPPDKDVELRECKDAFEAFLVEKHLSNAKSSDMWGAEIYANHGIESMWYAWKHLWLSRLTPRKSASEAVEACDVIEHILAKNMDQQDKECLIANIRFIRQALTSEPVAGWSEREVLCRALDKMGWDEIRAFQEELNKGQSIYEDAGGYFMRAIKRLFGIVPREEVVTYQQAAQKLIDEATAAPVLKGDKL